MVNHNHLEYLKQGKDGWNVWRTKNPSIKPDLSRSILPKLNLSEFDLSKADLSNSNLSNMNLSEAVLYRADLSYTDLSNADLSNTNLFYTIFHRTDLDKSDFHSASLRSTFFAFTDLSTAKNFETCQHYGPSSIDIDTLRQSQNLSQDFLQGIGLPTSYIERISSFFVETWQFYNCFISYTKNDTNFSRKLYKDLKNAGIQCCRWDEDLKIGQRLWRGIDHAIRQYDKLIVILSKHSLKSQGVQDEIERAFQKERNLRKRDQEAEVIYPVLIDNYLFSHHCTYEHAADLKAKRIGDFREWKDERSYQNEFQLLLKALKRKP